VEATAGTHIETFQEIPICLRYSTCIYSCRLRTPRAYRYQEAGHKNKGSTAASGTTFFWIPQGPQRATPCLRSCFQPQKTRAHSPHRLNSRCEIPSFLSQSARHLYHRHSFLSESGRSARRTLIQLQRSLKSFDQDRSRKLRIGATGQRGEHFAMIEEKYGHVRSHYDSNIGLTKSFLGTSGWRWPSLPRS